MKFIPYDRITLRTNKSASEIIDFLIQNSYDIPFATIYGPTDKLLEGKVRTDNSFKLRRHINYRNSFLPIMHGNIVSNDKGTIIDIKFKLHIAVVIVAALFLTIGIIVIGFSLYSILSNVSTAKILLLPLAILLFGYFMTQAGFNYELRKVKKLINEYLV